MIGGIELYFCKKCMVYTDTNYWKYDRNSNRPKGKCSICKTEKFEDLIKIKVMEMSKIENEKFNDVNLK